MPSEYEDRFWDSPDGLKLHFRDYEGRTDRPPVICLHGLTRNARDFDVLARRLAGEWRVLVPEMRGRGGSEYAKDSMTYSPATYVADILALLEQEGVARFVAVGTSLGGLMTMMIAAQRPGLIAGAVLNDVGPALEPAGLSRIRAYLGQARSFPTWLHAARALQDVHGEAYPDFEIEQWLQMAKRCMVVQQNGRIGFDYDMAIAEPFGQDDGAAPPDLWPAFDALSRAPLLIVRGEASDVFAKATMDEMLRRHPQAQGVTVPRTGHAPTLDEPEVVDAINGFLDGVK